MQVENEKYQISILNAPHYSVNSVDNKLYDMCIQVCKVNIANGHHTSYEMQIFTNATGEAFSVVLLCSYCTQIFDNSGILADDTFYMLLDRKIVAVNLKDYSYQIYDIPQPLGSYYEMYKCQEGVLIHGELELLLLSSQFQECWRYATQDILFGKEPLSMQDGRIQFTDYEGNYHEVDMTGKQVKYIKYEKKTIMLDLTEVNTPKQFQLVLKKALDMPDYYGMNWDAYWDGITGLVIMPDELILEGWHLYKAIQKEDARQFEAIMKAYNELDHSKQCECVYKYWI